MDTVKTMDIQSQKTKNKNMSTVQTESTHVLCLRGKNVSYVTALDWKHSS